MTMLALSLWQPWASLMLASDPANNGSPPKEIETRGWFPRPRGALVGERFGIHATKNIPADERSGLIDSTGYFREPFRTILLRCGLSIRDPWNPASVLVADRKGEPLPLPLASVLGSVVLEAWHSTDETDALIAVIKRKATDRVIATMTEAMLGDYGPRRFGWRCIEPVRLPKPIACRGGQQLWALPEDVESAIRRSAALSGDLFDVVAR